MSYRSYGRYRERPEPKPSARDNDLSGLPLNDLLAEVGRRKALGKKKLIAKVAELKATPVEKSFILSDGTVTKLYPVVKRFHFINMHSPATLLILGNGKVVVSNGDRTFKNVDIAMPRHGFENWHYVKFKSETEIINIDKDFVTTVEALSAPLSKWAYDIATAHGAYSAKLHEAVKYSFVQQLNKAGEKYLSYNQALIMVLAQEQSTFNWTLKDLYEKPILSDTFSFNNNNFRNTLMGEAIQWSINQALPEMLTMLGKFDHPVWKETLQEVLSSFIVEMQLQGKKLNI